MNSNNECEICGVGGQTLRCGRCQQVYYCCKDHQRQDWKRHKVTCQKQLKQHVVTDKKKISDSKIKKLDDNQNSTDISFEGSSEKEILKSQTQVLNPSLDFRDNSEANATALRPIVNSPTKMPPSLTSPKKTREYPEVKLTQSESPLRNRTLENTVFDQICKNVVSDLEKFGVCVVDNFLGAERGKLVLDEVLTMYNSGVFRDGQLVTTVGRKGDHKNIRSDKITWIDGSEKNCANTIQLIREVDAVIMRSNKTATGPLSHYTINGRTKAMVACYPGSGAHYVKHVDNPNRDGRCVTAIYYLNKDWDAKRNGGLLRIFPLQSDKVADIEPIFDRLLFFWSDRRNPHEVQPAYHTRYAITLWYFDAIERAQAGKLFQITSKTSKTTTSEP